MSSDVQLFDAAGRRRSPATLPDFHAGRAPANKGQRYAVIALFLCLRDHPRREPLTMWCFSSAPGPLHRPRQVCATPWRSNDHGLRSGDPPDCGAVTNRTAFDLAGSLATTCSGVAFASERVCCSGFHAAGGERGTRRIWRETRYVVSAVIGVAVGDTGGVAGRPPPSRARASSVSAAGKVLAFIGSTSDLTVARGTAEVATRGPEQCCGRGENAATD
jgi:hypothetical protein